MPIPAKLRPDDPYVPPYPPRPEPHPHLPEEWAHTKVALIGRGGEGDEISLTGFQGAGEAGIFMQPGATGLDLPPMELHADTSPGIDGAWFRSARAVERNIMLPLYLYGVDRRSVRALKRMLADAANPKNGSCILRLTEGDGSSRFLTCWYTGGLEGDEGEDQAGFTWCRYGMQLSAYDPWWYGDGVVSAEWSTGNSPVRTLVQDIVVDNSGDVEAWPVWEFSGPFKDFRVWVPDGRGFGMSARQDYDLVGVGQMLTVDTRPGAKTMRRSDGLNMWAFVDTSPQLFPLPPGRSKFQVSLTRGAFPASVRMTLYPRFESF